MSGLQYGRAMDQASGSGGSVKRARERAEAEAELRRQAKESSPTAIPRLPIRNPNNVASRAQAPTAVLQTRDENGNIGLAISRPTPVAQWPLAGPLTSPSSSDGSEPYRPPPGKSQPPQRPPRPSRVPSMLDGSRVQEHTPVFQYTPQSQRVSELSIPETPATASSRPTTQSSVGSIPDFPLPVGAPPPPPPVSRRSVNLGPPPSARRGASSFYSMASYVSPIPEESPRTRSHTSYASSAAMPESFGTISPGLSQDEFYDDIIAEESVYSDDADERGLVRSASIGRKGKPSLVTTRSSDRGEMVPFVLPIRPTPMPVQSNPFPDGTGYVDESSSSSGGASSTRVPTVGAALSADTMLGAIEAASATDPSSVRNAAPAQRPFRLSALRRPPRLDIDAVKRAEARGSLTSLPDLIRRATRLAAMMEKGRRPASRFDLDYAEEKYGRDPEKDFSYEQEKHQSGLSDMLAAFPPPAQANINARRSIRQSIRQSGTSWPLPLGNRKSSGGPGVAEQAMNDLPQQAPPANEKRGRRCCGLPLWGFLLLLFILAIIITAAIVIPLEFFVIHKQVTTSATAQPALSDCQSQLTCANGGTNVITQGVCSCICSNGFTGTNCTIPSAQGCTTTTLSSTDSTLSNATLGEAVPRLIQQAETNFSIPLSATTILSKFNSANLSCIAENALVTFNGQSANTDSLAAAAAASGSDSGLAQVNAAVPVTVTILSGVPLTLTIENPQETGTFGVIVSTLTEPTTLSGSFSTIFRTTLSSSKARSTSPPTTTTTTTTTTTATRSAHSTSIPVTSTQTSTSSTANPTATFAVTDEVLDFARVAVLFVLQEETLSDAATAQTTIQKFFTTAASSSSSGGVTVADARSLSIGGGNTIDLVNFLVNLAT